MPLEALKNGLQEKGTKLKLIYGAAALLLVAGGIYWYKSAHSKVIEVKQPPLVRTCIAGQNSGINQVFYPGALHGRQESILAFQVAGKINKRLVSIGDKVSAGQVLMTLDPQDIQQSYDAAKAQAAAAASNMKLAQDNAARFNTLKENGAVSEATAQSYRTQYDAARAAYNQAQAALNAAQHQMDYTSLTADCDGVIASIVGEPGMVVAAGTQLVTLVKSGEQEIQISVPESALAKLTAGQEAEITFWALDGAKCKGHIRDIGAMADPYTKTYKVNVSLDDIPAGAKLGMTAKVSFPTNINNKKLTLTLPSSAIYTVNGKKQVWVVKDNKVSLKDIEISGYEGNNVLVEAGISPKDEIVTAGISKLMPEQEVRTAEKTEQKSGGQ